MHSFQNFIVRLIPNHPPPLETRIWKLVVRALIMTHQMTFDLSMLTVGFSIKHNNKPPINLNLKIKRQLNKQCVYNIF